MYEPWVDDEDLVDCGDLEEMLSDDKDDIERVRRSSQEEIRDEVAVMVQDFRALFSDHLDVQINRIFSEDER